MIEIKSQSTSNAPTLYRDAAPTTLAQKLDFHERIEFLDHPPGSGNSSDCTREGAEFLAWETRRRGYYCVARRGVQRKPSNSVVAVITEEAGGDRIVAEYWRELPRRYGNKTRDEELRILLVFACFAVVWMLIFSDIFVVLSIPLAYLFFVRGKRYRPGRATLEEAAEKARLEELLDLCSLRSVEGTSWIDPVLPRRKP